jgi:hypothetical protein
LSWTKILWSLEAPIHLSSKSIWASIPPQKVVPLQHLRQS